MGQVLTRQRPHDRGGPSRDPTVSREPEGPGPAPLMPLRGISLRGIASRWRQPEDGGQVAGPAGRGRPPHRPERAALNDALGRSASGGLALRRHTLLPLDDRLYALQPTIAHLTRSALHRCLSHGVSRLPETEGDKPQRSRFKADPIGVFHLDIAEVHTEQGKLSLCVAIDRTSKFAFAQLHQRARHLGRAPDQGGLGPRRDRPRPFEYVCAGPHRAPADQALPPVDERSGRADEPHPQGRDRPALPLRQPRRVRAHLQLVLDADNYARRLKTLKGLTPCEFITRSWPAKPHKFTADPHHELPGPNS